MNMQDTHHDDVTSHNFVVSSIWPSFDMIALTNSAPSYNMTRWAVRLRLVLIIVSCARQGQIWNAQTTADCVGANILDHGTWGTRDS